jgi:hypothetical protein
MLGRWGIQLSFLCRYYIRMLQDSIEMYAIAWVSATDPGLDSQQNFPNSYPPWHILQLIA